MTGCTSKQPAYNPTVEKEASPTELLLSGIKNRQVSLNKLSSYLSELESQMSLIFAASPDIIVLLDKHANILKISDAAFSILGYKRTEIVGKSLWEYLAVSDLDKTKQYVLKLQQGEIESANGNTPLVNHWISKSGKYVKILWRLSLFDYQESQIVGIASDISSFKENENYCIKLLQRAVNLSTDGVVITDSHSKGNEIIYANGAFVEITGYDQSELLGKNCKFLQSAECMESRAINTLRECIKTDKGCDLLLQNVRKNGEIFYNKISVSPVKEGNEIINHIWITRDVTEDVGVKYEWSPNTERGFYFL
jgi:PAS domain S-box-containing protein